MSMILFLALIMAPVGSHAGVQIEAGSVGGSIPYLAPETMIKYRINWGGDLSIYDREIALLDGHPLFLTVFGSPTQYRTTPYECGAIKDYQAYSQFIVEMIDRYHPYAIEIWNEPDMPNNLPNLYGCMSAKEYGDMANYVCQYLRQQRPDVRVVAGALAGKDDMYAKAINPKVCPELSFHHYPSALTLDGLDWNIVQRTTYFRSLGFQKLWLTETSLLDATTPEQQIMQADWMRYTLSLGFEQVFWYTLSGNGWRHSDLIENGIRKPVYEVYVGK